MGNSFRHLSEEEEGAVEFLCIELLCKKKYFFQIINSVLYINSFLTNDDSRSFCGQCRSRSDCTEHAVLSLIYTDHIFIIDYN